MVAEDETGKASAARRCLGFDGGARVNESSGMGTIWAGFTFSFLFHGNTEPNR